MTQLQRLKEMRKGFAHEPTSVAPDVPRREQVEVGAAAVLEQGYVVGHARARQAGGAKLEKVGLDPLARNDAAANGIAEIARPVDGEPPAVDEEAGSQHRSVVAFAHIRRVGADKVEVRARLQPLAPDERLAR